MLIATLLSSCARQPDDVIRFGLASAPISLDPRYATDATSARLNRLLYSRLVDFDDASKPVPSLASWEVISPVHYRFTLNGKALQDKGRQFQNNKKLRAEDVKATYDFVLKSENASPHRASIALIKEIEVIDEDTVDFHLERPDPLFPGYLVIGILPADEVKSGAKFDRESMGSGPFTFLDWPEDGLIRLKRLADQQIFEFLHISDATVRVLKLLRGEIDLLQNDLPGELVSYLEKKGEHQVFHREGSNFTYLGFNMEDPVLKNDEIRQAIAYAVNRDEIIKYVLGGQTRKANALLSPDHWAGNASLQAYEYNPQRARELLSKLGYSIENPLSITYKTSSDPFRIRIATIIQQQLAEVGIQVDLRSFDWATFYGDIKAGRFQMYSLSWVGIKSPDIFRYVFHGESVPPAGANRGRYNNAGVNFLIEEADKSVQLEERAKLYRKIQERLLKTLPYVPLWYEEHFYAAANDIRDYKLAADGNYDGLINVHRIRTN
jgi:peptide/nickel transport system substrate-binding protein